MDTFPKTISKAECLEESWHQDTAAVSTSFCTGDSNITKNFEKFQRKIKYLCFDFKTPLSGAIKIV